MVYFNRMCFINWKGELSFRNVGREKQIMNEYLTEYLNIWGEPSFI
jgi:hypothetical protein